MMPPQQIAKIAERQQVRIDETELAGGKPLSLSRVWTLCYYSPRMNFTARSYRFAYFYWPNLIGGRRTAPG